MARPLRIEFPGAWYHVMSRGNNHQQIYESDGDYFAFLELLQKCSSIWALECHAYCLLLNHYHLLVSTPRGNLSRAMRHLNGVYTQHFNRSHSRDGHLFRGRYKAILVDKDSYLLQAARYIHLNPVKSGLVPLPENYRWSSYRFYLSSRGKPKALLTQKLVELFGPGKRAVELMRKFTEAGIDEQTEDFYKSKRQTPIFGSPKFIQWVKNEKFEDRNKDKEIPKNEKIINPPSLDNIIRLVAQAYEVHPHSISRSLRGSFNEPRHVAIYLARFLTGCPLHEIGRRFGNVNYNAVSNICSATEKRRGENKEFKLRLMELERTIQQEESENREQVLLQ